MKQKHSKLIFWFLLILSFSLSVSGQTAAQQTKKAAVTVQDLKLDSKLMARQMPYKIILPAKYDTEKTKRYSVIYLLHGLGGHYDNWTSKAKLADHAANYNYIIVTAEGDDGWYSDSVTKANDKYESYIVKELIPEIDKKFRTVADKQHRSIAGLSMGGYGSIKFGLKYPEMFILVGSFSGALPATGWTDKNSPAWLSKSIMPVFGDASHETRLSNDIYKIVREMPDAAKKNLPFIYLDCGTEDFLIVPNRDFAALLFEKKIPHEFRQLPGKHDWNYWNSQVQEFLKMSAKFVK